MKRDGQPAEIGRRKLDAAKAFTRAYRAHLNDHVAVREAACLKEQYPALCRDIADHDLIAGRIWYQPLVGFGLEFHQNRGCKALGSDDVPHSELSEETRRWRRDLGTSSCGFCCDYWGLKTLSEGLEPGSAERREIEAMMEFWYAETTRYRYNHLLTDRIVATIGRFENVNSPRQVSGFQRLCCVSLDYDKLLRLGIPGMIARIQEKRAQANGETAGLYEGMRMALEVLVDVCRHYERQAREKAEAAPDATRGQQLLDMAAVLAHITREPPRTLHQAMQLFWLYNQLTDTFNWGRMDIYLGDFYARDIDEGVLTEAGAEELLTSLWTIISEIRHCGGGTRPNARIIVGGKGRRNEANANRFALAAMDVSRRLKVTEPNLTLRFYDGQNPALLAKAYDLLAEGCIHPGLYYDDVHIPMVRKAYTVPLADAEHYVPEGCGEIMIDHVSVGSPNNILNYMASLNLVLHNGYDRLIHTRMGLAQGEPADFDTFDKLLAAFKKQVDYTNDILAERQALEHKAERESAAFVFMSMLTDDCIERGKSLYDGGARYLGGIIETFGLTNVADSMVAIREFVYEKRAFTLEQLVQMLDANWDGCERERQMMLGAPKFGNDDPVADAMYRELCRFVCTSAAEKAAKHGLHFFLNCNLNPGGLSYATNTPASADGRRHGDAMALGNAPTAGRDKAGLTALLNSMSKNEGPHSGFVQNLKVNKSMFSPECRPKLKALLDTYFAAGGCQLMVTALNREDLENALKEPEKYQNLLVRVAGWTARFLELNPRYQAEILNRTLYE
ncbi:MAG: hypothetical protein JXR37_30915 [Kiritimatiellae bacterium]|nr:hypothetical protein [Kiritimatiellia bacterium]